VAILQSRSSEHASNVYKMCLDDKLGSAPAPLVVPEVGQLRQPSGNLSDGGVYMCDDTTHAAAATVEVAFSGGEWHVSDPDATEDDDDAVAMVHAEGSDATKASFANWAELPDGILREVTRHMAPSYLRVMRLVCRSWAEFGGRHLSSLKPERLDGPRLAQRFPHLRSLDLSHCQRIIVHPKNELRLQSSLTDASLAWLAPLKHLRTLGLRSCVMVEGGGLRHITALSLLRSLDLTGCVRLTNKGLDHVVALTALTALNLRECRLITNDGLRRLEPLVHLKTFSMSNCTSVTDRGLQSLAKLTGLEHISISRCNYVSNVGFSLLLLSPLPHLKRIVVRKCPGVTEDGLREIAAKKAAAHGCKLELPAPRPEPRRMAPAPFLDAWLNQGAHPQALNAHPAGNIHAGTGHGAGHGGFYP
jgi:hypothetical protein